MGWVNVIVIKIYSGRTIQVLYFLQETILSLVKTAISFDRTLAQCIVSNGTINGTRKGLEGSGTTLYRLLSQRFAGTEKISVKAYIKVSRCASRDLNGAPP